MLMFLLRCSGITRITVTVVVIMFELTGALTYILPTMVRRGLSLSLPLSSFSPASLPRTAPMQIVVMVTKAVSDQFGGGGIADQMIRFNGYPLLENHELVFGVPGALTVLPSRGDKAREVDPRRAQSRLSCGASSSAFLRKA